MALVKLLKIVQMFVILILLISSLDLKKSIYLFKTKNTFEILRLVVNDNHLCYLLNLTITLFIYII